MNRFEDTDRMHERDERRHGTGLIRDALATVAFISLCYVGYVVAWGMVG